jgi:hypothetical protein
MDEKKLESVDRENDLGIMFDENLSFEEHISNQVKKANSLAGMLRRSFVYMDIEMFKQLFTSIVRPHLEYGAPIWNPYAKKYIDASKQISGLSHLSYQERLEVMKLPTLQYRRYRRDMIEAYKISHVIYDNEATRDFLMFRTNDERQHNFRGHHFNLYKESYKKDIRKFSYRGRIIDQWNNLPDAVAEAPTLNSFKNTLDKVWEREGIIYDPDINIHVRTSLRRTRNINLN